MPVFAASASKAAIEAASDVHKWELDEGLGQLVELWLLEASEKLDEAKRRYGLHPLTRAFAQNRLFENQDLERQTRIRLAKFFESFAISAGGDRYTWERYDEIEEEKDNIFALIEWCFENGEAMAGMKLTKSVTFFMSQRGFLYEFMIFEQKALEVAQQINKTDDLAWFLVHGIAWLELNGGDLEKGETLIREGLKIYEDLKDLQGIRDTLRNLGAALRFKGDFDNAREFCERGVALANSSNDELAVASFKRELLGVVASEGKLMEAQKGLESILPIFREKNELYLPGTLGNLAEVNRQLGNYDTAFNIGSEGLELAKKMKKRYTVGWISIIMAKTEAARGNYQPAISFAQQALEFFERSGLFPKEIEELKSLIAELQEKLTS